MNLDNYSDSSSTGPVAASTRLALHQVAKDRPSFGYRRVTAMVRRQTGLVVNSKRVRRIMRLDHLTLQSGARPPRKHLPKHPGKILTTAPDVAWQMDAKYVWCGRDRWMVLQNVIDTCTGEWIGYWFDKRYRKQEVVQLLEKVALSRWPQTARAPGTKLRMDDLRAYASDRVVDTTDTIGFQVEFIQNHLPEDNGMVESFHASLDRDYLNLVEFATRQAAEARLAWAWKDYNESKPKERLDWKTPREFYLEKVKNANQN